MSTYSRVNVETRVRSKSVTIYLYPTTVAATCKTTGSSSAQGNEETICRRKALHKKHVTKCAKKESTRCARHSNASIKSITWMRPLRESQT